VPHRWRPEDRAASRPSTPPGRLSRRARRRRDLRRRRHRGPGPNCPCSRSSGRDGSVPPGWSTGSWVRARRCCSCWAAPSLGGVGRHGSTPDRPDGAGRTGRHRRRRGGAGRRLGGARPGIAAVGADSLDRLRRARGPGPRRRRAAPVLGGGPGRRTPATGACRGDHPRPGGLDRGRCGAEGVPMREGGGSPMQSLALWLRAEWDRILGTLLVVAGGLCLVVTYQAVANDRFVAEQMADVASGGLGGLFFVAVGIMLRLQADLHDEWRKLDRIEAALRGEPLPDAAELLAAARQGPALRRAPGPELQPALSRSGQRGRRLPAVLTGGGLGVGVAGLLVAGAVVGVTQLIGRSRLAARKGRLLAPFLRPVPAAAVAAAGTAGVVLVAPGLTRFHLDGCPTLSGTRATRLPRQEVNGGLSPCQICGAS